MKSVRTVVLSGLLGVIACSAKLPEPTSAAQQSGDSGAMMVSGMVKRVEVSGGCWQFVASDSTHYELRAEQAPADLLVDGKQASLNLKPRPDLMSNCMVGQIVDVVR